MIKKIKSFFWLKIMNWRMKRLAKSFAKPRTRSNQEVYRMFSEGMKD